MLFVLVGFDRKDGGADIRRRTRDDHLRFVMQNEHLFRYGGTLLDDEGKMASSLMMLELSDRSALDAFLQEEPYSRAGLYDPFIVRESRQVVPPLEPGFIEATIAAETSFGAGRPGISAVVMTMSCLAMCSAVSAACLAWYSFDISLA